MRTKEQLAEYMREYNKRPEVIARKSEQRAHKNELARQRYQYQKLNPAYRERQLKNLLRHYATRLEKHGYTVTPPKEADT